MLVESFSGVRGLYKEDLSKEVIRSYASAYARFLARHRKSPQVVIGMDTRPSSGAIHSQMKSALLASGIGVIDAGFNTTPAIQHGVRICKADGGIIISASHNEPEWNGWKLLSPTGAILPKKDMDQIIRMRRNPLQGSAEAKQGSSVDKSKELRDDYITFLLNTIGQDAVDRIRKAGSKLVLDPNGGAATVLLRDLFSKIGIQPVYKNMDLGVFNRLIEPNALSLAYLTFYVEDLNADLGAGWDCDGDRVEIVLPNSSAFTQQHGKIISGQYILAIIVDDFLSDYKGSRKIVVVNDATSGLIAEIAEKYGATIVETEVGETNIVEKMDELGAPLGGEGSSSGPIVPPSRCRDGLLALLLILKIIAKRKKPLGEILGELPSYTTSRLNIACAADPVKLRKKLEGYWKAQEHIQEIRKTGDETGGLKIIRKPTKEGPGWIWYKQSKTEGNVFRIITDAKSKLYADKLLAMGEKAFNDCLAEMKK